MGLDAITGDNTIRDTVRFDLELRGVVARPHEMPTGLLLKRVRDLMRHRVQRGSRRRSDDSTGFGIRLGTVLLARVSINGNIEMRQIPERSLESVPVWHRRALVEHADKRIRRGRMFERR